MLKALVKLNHKANYYSFEVDIDTLFQTIHRTLADSQPYLQIDQPFEYFDQTESITLLIKSQQDYDEANRLYPFLREILGIGLEPAVTKCKLIKKIDLSIEQADFRQGVSNA